MRQRAMIAMALTNDPKLLIADEPTTALDVTTQAQILQLIERLQAGVRDGGDHDHPRPRGGRRGRRPACMVMYAGRVVESGTLDQIFYDPQHPYTWGLLGSLTRIDRPRTARLAQIAGQPPSLISLPEGCHFRTRCPHAFDQVHADAAARAARSPERGPHRPLLAHARAEADAAGRLHRRDRPRGARRMTASRAPTSAEGARRARRRRALGGGDRRARRAASRSSRSTTSSSTSRSRRGSCSTARSARVRAVDDVSFTVSARRDARPGRRVGLRQVDAEPHDPAADRADLGLGALRGPRDHRALEPASCARCGRRCR